MNDNYKDINEEMNGAIAPDKDVSDEINNDKPETTSPADAFVSEAPKADGEATNPDTIDAEKSADADKAPGGTAEPDAEQTANADKAPGGTAELDAEKNAEAFDDPVNSPVDDSPRWDYAGRCDDNVKIELPKRKQKTRGGVVFALVMSIIFTVALALLLVFTLKEGPNAPDRGGYDLGIVQSTGVLPEGSFATSDTLEETKNSVVLITCKIPGGTSTGSGFIIEESGLIVTNRHVIADATKITVSLYDGRQFNATVVGASERDDLALIKINAGNLRVIPLAKSQNVKLGETVYAIGAPGGEEFAWSVTRGAVSCVLRDISVYDDSNILEKRMKVIQTDAAVNHGNSGGPLINAAGQVVGIVTLKLADDFDGMGFAIPIDGALEILYELAKNGAVDGTSSAVSSPRPLIGIYGGMVEAGKWYSRHDLENSSQVLPVDESVASADPDSYFRAEVTGVLVISLTEGQDAINHLQPYDIITSIDGYDVENIYEVMAVVNKHMPGDSVEVTARRAGKDIKVNIKLGQ